MYVYKNFYTNKKNNKKTSCKRDDFLTCTLKKC